MTLVFVFVQIDTCLEFLQLILGQKVCHYLGGDMGGGGSRQMAINGDRGRGVKNLDFYGDILFEWPLITAVKSELYKMYILPGS